MTQEGTTARRKLPAEERRRQILEAAARVFARKGYHPAKTKEIAGEAGVSEGTLYNYFGSKREILVSLTTLLVTDTLTEVLAQAPVEDERAFIKAILRDRFAVVDQNPPLMRALVQEALQDESLRAELFGRMIAEVGLRLLAWVQDRIAAGTFRPVNPSVAVAVIMAPLFLIGVMGLDQATPLAGVSREELIRQLTDLYLNGLRVRPEEED